MNGMTVNNHKGNHKFYNFIMLLSKKKKKSYFHGVIGLVKICTDCTELLCTHIYFRDYMKKESTEV